MIIYFIDDKAPRKTEPLVYFDGTTVAGKKRKRK